MIKINRQKMKVNGNASVILAETTMILKSLKEELGDTVIDEVYRIVKMNDEEIEKEIKISTSELLDKISKELKNEDNN